MGGGEGEVSNVRIRDSRGGENRTLRTTIIAVLVVKRLNFTSGYKRKSDEILRIRVDWS